MLGKFIVFEGPDGSGQTTQAKILAEKLSEQGRRVVVTAEPTHESKYSHRIWEILHKKIPASNKEIQELISLDRGEHLKNLILPALERGDIVITSRYYYSTFAYGMIEFDLDWLKSLNKDYLSPHITFLLNVRPEVCIERISKRGKPLEFFETLESLKTITENYKSLLPIFKEIHLIDGERPTETVSQEIVELVSKIL